MGSAAAFYVMRFSVSVVEHVLQLFEEALALFVVFFFQGALELLQGDVYKRQIQQSGLCFEDAVAVLQKLAAGEKITG